MLHCPDETSQGNNEQEDPNADDTPYHLKARNKAKPFPPGSNSDHQQAHHLKRGEQNDTENPQTMFISV